MCPDASLAILERDGVFHGVGRRDVCRSGGDRQPRDHTVASRTIVSVQPVRVVRSGLSWALAGHLES